MQAPKTEAQACRSPGLDSGRPAPLRLCLCVAVRLWAGRCPRLDVRVAVLNVELTGACLLCGLMPRAHEGWAGQAPDIRPCRDQQARASPGPP